MSRKGHDAQRIRGSVLLLSVVSIALAGCPPKPTQKYTIGGSVTGLLGSGLMLQNNLGDGLPVTANGNFTFATPLATGSGYVVTVLTQPSSPSQTCSVYNYSGVVADTNVTNVTVTCTTKTYSVGGVVNGLLGSGLVLQNNDRDDLAVSTSGAFAFSTTLASGSNYSVTVASQPMTPSQTCTVTNATGTVGGGDVTSIVVACATNRYPVGGTATGLTGSGLVLQNNSGDDLSIAGDGPFTFATQVASGSAYSVSVKTQPSSPTQLCAVTNGAGTVAGSAITSVSVACTNTYWLGGSVSGLLLDGLVLASPGEPDLQVSAGTTGFAFSTKLPVGAFYDVTVKTQPAGQECTAQNGSGTVGTADVSSAIVTCRLLWIRAVAGYCNTFGIASDSSLFAWGYNADGQLGDGTRTDSLLKLHVASGVASISTGWHHTVALKTDGTVWTWGSNAYGQLGDGTLTDRYSPAPVGSGFAAIATGLYHTLALKTDGTLWAWGYNGLGQLGLGDTANRLTPVQVGSGFASIAAGNTFTLALKTDGTLWAWGTNQKGELGVGDTTDRLTPIQVASGFASISGGVAFTLALKTDGTLWAWGYNNYGQLGLGDRTDRLTPVQVGSGFASIAAGWYHSVALKADGTVWAWGENSLGELGDGTTIERHAPVQAGSGFASVTAGTQHTLATKSDHTLWAWGGNSCGQFGTGDTTNRLVPTQVP